MATNWSSSSGFGGGLGGSNLSRSSGGGGVGVAVGGGSTPTKLGEKAPLNPTQATTPAYTPIYDQQYAPPSNSDGGPYKQYNRGQTGDWWNSGTPNPSGYADPAGAEAEGQRGLEFRSLTDLLAGQYQPQLDSLGVDRSILTARNGIDNRGLDLRRQDLTSNAGFDRQRLGLKLQDLGIDRQGNALKLAGLGIDRKDNTSERGYITRLRELAGLTNTNASNRISFEGQDKARGIKSNYITGGTTFSPGHTYDQRANYLRTLSDLESQDLGYKEQVAGFDRRDEGLNFSDERIGLSEQEVGLANQRLDIMSSQLGIDRAQLEDSLTRGLQQLGLEGEINALELLSALNNNTGEGAQIIAQIASDALALGLQPGDLMQGFSGNSLPVFG